MSKANVSVKITVHSLLLRKYMGKPDEWLCACGLLYGKHPRGEPDWVHGRAPVFVRQAHKAHVAEVDR